VVPKRLGLWLLIAAGFSFGFLWLSIRRDRAANDDALVADGAWTTAGVRVFHLVKICR